MSLVNIHGFLMCDKCYRFYSIDELRNQYTLAYIECTSDYDISQKYPDLYLLYQSAQRHVPFNGAIDCVDTICGGTQRLIDENIAPAIIRLNQKGYKTFACCAGHGKESETYVSFQAGIDIELVAISLPKRWTVEVGDARRTILSARLPDSMVGKPRTFQQLYQLKSCMLLNEWVRSSTHL